MFVVKACGRWCLPFDESLAEEWNKRWRDRSKKECELPVWKHVGYKEKVTSNLGDGPGIWSR